MAHASAAVNAAEAVLVDILRGEVAADSLSGYEAGSYLATTNEFIDGLAESSTFVGILGEASRWHPDAALSSTATVVADGVDYPFGEVTALGCFESLWEVNDPGQEQTGESTIGQLLPARMVVRYEPSRSVWLVTEGKSMVGEEGAPECPAAG